MDADIVRPRIDGVECHVETLEAENIRLRHLLSQATTQADRERQRSRRLGRIVEAASRVEAGRLAAEWIATPHRPTFRGTSGLGSAMAPRATDRLLPSGSQQATNDFLELLDRDGCLITASEDGPALSAAADEAEAIGRPWIEAWTRAEDREAVAAALDRARIGRPSRFQAQSETGGTIRWWDVAVTPIGAAPDRPERILAVSRDITELKLTEANQTLLMQELAHRMKNTMAMVQAVATQTMRNAPSLEAAGEALAARLLALAKAHDVLLQGSFARASLTGLVEGAVSLHGDGVAGRFRIAGPDLTLGPRHGMTLALMLHELGTNAAKYGALSVAAGWVRITWNVAEAAGGQTLRFRWEESGGPPVTPPTRTGFGTRLIARSLAHSFGGTAHLSYPREGAVLTFEAPLEAVMAA
ncbi:PAS domain S-box-containing protein [Methylobacterium fujisawaense]|uniref:Blue-light-activated histidine kinase n=1 Tax=Methylobacterium fujisawaense TaxID=107400 RepID=A0ABR6D9F8_9HYPH|nr:PAS domain-containing sensor histidine kinase [Methylobacterium fujisawaense]MBA9062427.1 PAS domain S-box-containing protein [Methylobacterium fujisawaense]